tara:strand:+ start:803 stop:1135 length:333 start_codon:yes stop_codon:yes gene_type:complete
MEMEVDLTEAMLLICSGILLSAFFSLIHFASSLNRFNGSFAPLSSILLGIVSIYAIILLTNDGNASSVRDSMASAIVGIVHLFPLFAAILTIVLFRITLLTNRSVGASSQ